MKKYLGALLLALWAVPLIAQQHGGMAVSHTPTLMKPAEDSPVVNTPVDVTRVIARVNGAPITEGDVQEQMRRLFPYYAIHGGKVPEQYKPEIRKKAVNQLVIDELTFQEAKKLNIRVPEANMRQVIAQAKRRLGSESAYEQFAKAQYGSVAELERRIRRATVIAKFQDVEIVQKSKVSDEKLREYYEKNKKIFKRPESVWLQTISIMVPPNPSEEQKKMGRKRIEELLPQAKATKSYQDFGLLAEHTSEDEYRVNMGDHKWVHVAGMPPAVNEAVAAMKPGEVSGILDVAGSLVICRVNERSPEKQMSFSEIRDKLRQQLEEANQKDLVSRFEKNMAKNAKIEMP